MTTQREVNEVSRDVPRFVRQLFRSEAHAWPFEQTAAVEAFLQYAHDEGIQPLLHELLSRADAWSTWPLAIRERLHAEARKRAALEVVRAKALTAVLGALSEAGIEPLLFKGVPLAYQVYPSPHLRPSMDIDLLIQASDRDVAFRTLLELEYSELPGLPGDWVLCQRSFSRTITGAGKVTLDVHWAVSYRQVFAQALSYEELRAHAVPVPELGDCAFAPGLAYAVLLAAAHLAGHHSGRPRLIWLHDIHLLREAARDRELQALVSLAQNKRLCAVTADALQKASDVFGTQLSDGTMRELAAHEREPSALYLEEDRTRWQELVLDVRMTPGCRQRVRLLLEHAFPPASYMRARYPDRTKHPLALLYIRRGLNGIRKLRSRRRSGGRATAAGLGWGDQ